MIFVDKVYERLKCWLLTMQMAEFGQLGIVTLHRANAKSFLNIRGYQKGSTGEKMRVELRQEDMYSRQIEVAEMNITVGDGLPIRPEPLSIDSSYDNEPLTLEGLFLIMSEFH